MFTKVVTKNSIQVVLSFTAAHTYSHYSFESMIIVTIIIPTRFSNRF